ncbi:MAG: hypothetical protein GWP41_02330 [Planctomycetia bacterium]|nr:hypothetical protein [Planctomycetia bacterium]NCF98387.1 hypothetical protein [Planctomycetia bacterium]NCG11879.1 hypothetical protein [Planctomycetia bacterium]NCG55806.1 hypothetical protein [Pseudomonadota bacterium]
MKKFLLALVVVGGLGSAGCNFAPMAGEEKSGCASECATACASECDSAKKESCCGSCK